MQNFMKQLEQKAVHLQSLVDDLNKPLLGAFEEEFFDTDQAPTQEEVEELDSQREWQTELEIDQMIEDSVFDN